MLSFTTNRYKRVTADWFVKYYAESSHLEDKYTGLNKTVADSRLVIWHNDYIPAYASDSDITLIFEGTLHNRSELLNELRMQDADDTTILMNLLKESVETALQKIKGAYFLLVWQRSTGTLYAVRDRLAIVPAFHTTGINPVFSTKTESLLRHSVVSGKIDRLQLAQHITNNLIDPERTYFADIKQIPASTYIRFSSNATEKIKYWNRPDGQHSWATEDELEAFDSLFERATKRLVGQKKAGIFLSGGLDSISVAAVMSKFTQNTQALSLTFSDQDLDESAVQTRVARALNYDLTLLHQSNTLQGQNAVEAYLEMIGQWPSPNLSFWSPSFYRLAENGKEKGCEIILTGSGGDEWLGVGPSIAVDYWRGLHLKKLYNFWHTLCKSYYSSKFHNFKLVFWTYGLRNLLVSSFRQGLYLHAPELFSQFTKERLQRHLPVWAVADPKLREELLESICSHLKATAELFKQLKENYLVEAHFCIDNPLLSYEHEISYTMGERVGVSIFSPFMDSDLIDFMRRIRPEFLNKHGQLKSFLREYINKQFPDLQVQKQKKLISTIHYTALMESHAIDALKRLQLFPHLTDLELLDKSKFDLYKESASKNLSYWYYVRELMGLEVWLGAKRQ